MGKSPSISAGPVSSNDSYSVTEEQIASGALFLNVLSNDAKKSTLYSVDNGETADLLAQDQVLVAEQSRLGASIWITSDGRIGYSLDSARAQSLAEGETFTDSFIYAVRLSSGALVWQSVQVTITGTNDGPVATADAASVVEDAIATGSVASNDSDVDHGAVLTFAVAGTMPAGFAMASDGSWALDASDPTYQSLAVGETVEVTVAYTATDEHGASSSSTLTLTITGTNDAPRVSGAVAGAASEGGDAVALDALANAGDPDSGAVLSVVDVPAAEDLPAGVTYDAATHAFTLDPTDPAYDGRADGETVTVTVSYGVSDGSATTAASVSWTVTGTNDAPVAAAAVAAVGEDQIVGGTLVATDADAGASLVFEPYFGSPDGLTINADGTWTFDANQYVYQSLAEGESRDVAIDYVVTDDHGETSVSTLTITVTGANDAPVSTSQWAEATEGETASGTLIALDQDLGASLSYAVDGEAPAGFVLNANGSWTFDGTDPAYDGLAGGEVRLIEVPFTVTDEYGAASSSFMTISLTGTNDAPVRSGDPVTLAAGTEDTAYVVTQEQLLAGWSDAEGASLIATNLAATNASVADNGDGTFTITPATNFNGVVSLSYAVSDGLLSTAGQVQLAITAVNDPAVIGGTRAGSVTEATAASAGAAQFTGQLTISDIDSAASFQALSNLASDGGFGTFTVTTAGLWTYRLDNSNATVDGLATGQTLTDSFTVHSADGTAQLISITINGQTDPVYTPPPVSTAADPNDFDLLGDSSAAASQVNYTGTSSNNSAHGSQVGDTLVGLGGSDTLWGHGGDDLIWGDFQDPATPGSNINIDRLYGQAGNDTLYGGVGGDTLYGGSGDDILYANGSNGLDSERNFLFGGSGNDTIVGSVGGDEIRGGTGADTITTGAGGDRIFYGSFSDTGDTITDFTSGFDAFDFSALGPNYRFVGQVNSPLQLQPGQVGYVVSGGNTTLYLDGYGTEAGVDMEILLLDVTRLSGTDVWFG